MSAFAGCGHAEFAHWSRQDLQRDDRDCVKPAALAGMSMQASQDKRRSLGT